MANTSRRRFLELSAAAVGGAVACKDGVQPPGAGASRSRLSNWAGNYEYGVDTVHEAASLEDVREFVGGHDRLRALGTRHCFNGIADSSHSLLSLRPMSDVIELDAERRTVTVAGGVSYGQLCPYLHDKGFALHNLASLPHISIAGACATATHGSGVTNPNLAAAVSGLEIVTASGDVRRLSRETDVKTLRGAVVHLGALGVVTKLTLDIQPTFLARQHVYLDLAMSEMRDHFDEIVSAGYSVSLFTDWQDGRVNEVWIKSRAEEGSTDDAVPELFGARRATRNVHPIVALSPEHCTEQLGAIGPWYERLPHFRMGFTPSSGKELQSEYFVPRRDAVEAILAIERLRELVGPQLLISELRTVAADELWLSTCYGRDSLAIHFTWKQDWPSVGKILPVIERELSPFAVRPHWGKLFTLAPGELRSRYERLGEFKQLAAEFDPGGKFRNRFLDSTLYA